MLFGFFWEFLDVIKYFLWEVKVSFGNFMLLRNDKSRYIRVVLEIILVKWFCIYILYSFL